VSQSSRDLSEQTGFSGSVLVGKQWRIWQQLVDIGVMFWKSTRTFVRKHPVES